MPLLAARALTSRAVVSSMRIVISVAIAMYHTNCATRYYARSGFSILDTSAGWDASVSGWFPTQVVSRAKALQCAGTGLVESNTSSWTRESGRGTLRSGGSGLLDGKRGHRVSVPRRARSRSHPVAPSAPTSTSPSLDEWQLRFDAGATRSSATIVDEPIPCQTDPISY